MKITCLSCGKEYEDSEQACPYCASNKVDVVKTSYRHYYVPKSSPNAEPLTNFFKGYEYKQENSKESYNHVVLIKRCQKCGKKILFNSPCRFCGHDPKKGISCSNNAGLAGWFLFLGITLLVVYIIMAIISFIGAEVVSGILYLLMAFAYFGLLKSLSNLCTNVDDNTEKIDRQKEDIISLQRAVEELVRELDLKDYKKDELVTKSQESDAQTLDESEVIKDQSGAVLPIRIDRDNIRCPICRVEQRANRTCCYNCEVRFQKVEDIIDR